MASFSLTVNGRRHGVEADPAPPLLYVLRSDLALCATGVRLRSVPLTASKLRAALAQAGSGASSERSVTS